MIINQYIVPFLTFDPVKDILTICIEVDRVVVELRASVIKLDSLAAVSALWFSSVNGSSHTMLCYHKVCMQTLALIVTGDNILSGLKTLNDSLSTSHFVTKMVATGIEDLHLRDSCVSLSAPLWTQYIDCVIAIIYLVLFCKIGELMVAGCSAPKVDHELCHLYN